MTDSLFSTNGQPAARPTRPQLYLTRAHLRSVGPKDARFDPLDLSLVTSGEPASRVLVNLTNTGGKTTLIRLVTSVIVPAWHAAMGRANIGEYVASGDTAHVVVEWTDRKAGRYVTAGVYEWRDGTAPADRSISRLNRWWYTFRAEQIGIDDLPFDADGRRRPARAYRAALAELMAVHPAAEFVICDTQAEWAAALEARTTLDPSLFGYQMRMNDEEGNAGALVERFNTPEAVVRFFVGALFDDRALADFTDTLGEYSASCARRRVLEANVSFLDAMDPALVALSGAQEKLVAAGRGADSAGFAADELAGEIAVRLAGDRRAAEQAGTDAGIAAEQLERLTTALNRGEAIRAQLHLEAARFELAAVEETHCRARAAEEDARACLEAWRAVEPLVEWRAAQVGRDTAKAALEAADADLAPFNDALAAAGSALSAKYAALAEEASAQAEQATVRLEELIGQERRLDKERGLLTRRDAELRADLGQTRNLNRRAGEAKNRLVADGHAEKSETAAAAEARWEREVVACDETEAGLLDAAGRARRQRDTGEGQLRALEESERQATGRLAVVDARLVAHEQGLSRLSALDVVADLLAGERLDGDNLEMVAGLLAELAERAEATAAAARNRLAEVDAELAPLERGDLASTAADVEAVVVALVEAGVGAVTGWAWLASQVADPDARKVAAEADPAFANGVVVSDPSRLEQARLVLETSGETLKQAVWVCSVVPATIPTLEPARRAGFVVGPRRALYDPMWAAEHAAELRAERLELDGRLARNDADAAVARTAAGEVRAFSREWPPDTVSGLAGDQVALRGELNETASKVAGLKAVIAGANAELARVESERADVDSARRAAHGALRKVSQAAMLERDAVAAESARPAVEAEIDGIARQIVALDEQQRVLRDDRAAAERSRSDGQAQAERLRDEQARVGFEPAGTEPKLSLPELVEALRTAGQALAAKEAGLGTVRLRADWTAAEKAASDTRRAVDELTPTARAAAEGLAGTLEASSPAQRKHAVTAAEDAVSDAVRVATRAEIAVDEHTARVEEAKPKDNRQVHANLEPDWQPADLEDALAKRDWVSADNADIREQQRTATESHNRLTQKLFALQSSIRIYETALTLHPAPVVLPPRAWAGTAEQALDALKGRRADLDEATAEVANAREDRDLKSRAVRRVATEHIEATSVLRAQCAGTDSDETLAGEAARFLSLARREQALSADELGELVRHRATLVVVLEGLCDTARRLLRAVTRASKLPPGLGDLSDQPAFKIDFSALPALEVHGHLSTRVDQWAEHLRTHPKPSPDGRIGWLCEALADTISKPRSGSGWRVQVLKPDISGAVVYRSPDRIKDEYSGGQELTLAVLLYCALAAVRADQRAGTDRPAGTLLLDNPFGKASNPRLIAMQHALASRAGVQLICATGINDPDVRAAFEGDEGRVIELRNDRDQRQYLQYLRVVDSDAAARLAAAVSDGRPPDDERGYLSGSGYRIRSRR